MYAWKRARAIEAFSTYTCILFRTVEERSRRDGSLVAQVPGSISMPVSNGARAANPKLSWAPINI